MKKLLFTASLFTVIFTQGQEINIIPQPAQLEVKKGNFQLSKSTVLVVLNKGDQATASFLNSYLQTYYRLKLPVVNKAPKANYIGFSTWNDTAYRDEKESYQLIVDPKFIRITANGHAGSFYGMQSLIQLLPVVKPQDANVKIKALSSYAIPAVVIEDKPRFSYRGVHFDVCRHFFPVAYVKQYIDYLALHKFNTFHWHLTDDQGWRIEIKKYPKLTSVGGWRNGTIIGRYPGKGNDSIRYGGRYTQAEIKEVVKYATERFITVIPEIEMPGHASAAIAAHPELSCFPNEDTKVAKGTAWAGSTKGKQVQQAWGVFDDIFCAGNDNTFKFLEGVLDEVVPLFPSKYIHIGGDEAPKTHWKRCPKCQQRIKDLGLKDEHELQSYFIQRIEKYLNSKGKQIIGWDEILEGGLAPNATVMSWQGEKGGIEAAKQGHNVIMTPGNWCYFDHAQSRNEDSVTIGGYTPIEEVYSYEPVPKQLNNEQAKYILGAQANLWTEYIKNTRKVEYQLFPRIAAMSEVLWSPKEKRDSAGFENRLATQFKRYDLWKVNYSRAFFEIIDSILPTSDNNGLELRFRMPRTKGLHVWGRMKHPFFMMHGMDTPRKWSVNSHWIIESHPKDSTVIEYFLAEQNDSIPRLWDRSKSYSKVFKRTLHFNKATGKQVITSVTPSPSYPGNGGAFGLVNGVRADKFNSTEWLGWSGKEVEIAIDLGKTDSIKEVVLHVWKQEPSWIYLPASIEVLFDPEPGSGLERRWATSVHEPAAGWPDPRKITIPVKATTARFVYIRLKPVMQIPEGRQGAGKPAWIFLDEVEIN